jgi:hypothetical protein
MRSDVRHCGHLVWISTTGANARHALRCNPPHPPLFARSIGIKEGLCIGEGCVLREG